MERICCRLLTLVGVLWAGPGRAAESAARPWLVPPLDGEVAGEFTPLLLPGAPSLRWRVTVATIKPGERSVQATIEAPGLQMQMAAVLDPLGEGTWRLATGKVDLGEWFGWLVPKIMPDSPAASLTGELNVQGEGTWRREVLAGRIEIAVRDARFEDPTRRVVIEGIGLRVVLDDFQKPRTAGIQELTWRSGKYDTLPLGAGRAEFALDGEELRIVAAQVALFGGELRLASTVVSTRNADLTVAAAVEGIEIGQILFLLPPVLAAAQGKLDGQLSLRRDAAGLQIGSGRLALRTGETADLRMMPTPGLLSSQLPPAVKQHYPGLGRMETGGVPLRAEQLEVILSPAGDAEGRSATVQIKGGPADASLKAPIVLQLNVRGPLDQVVKFGTNSKLRFGGGK
jgi:hypothetical protein